MASTCLSLLRFSCKLNDSLWGICLKEDMFGAYRGAQARNLSMCAYERLEVVLISSFENLNIFYVESSPIKQKKERRTTKMPLKYFHPIYY